MPAEEGRTVAYKIAFFADTHVGYAAKCRTDPVTGINERVLDGYKGLKETVTDILAHEVDAVVHGGDLFHRSQPTVTDVVWVRKQLKRFADAGVPFYGNTGNHDFANERGKYPATSAVEDVDRGVHILTKAHEKYQIAEGLNLVMVSHAGVVAQEKTQPEPIQGEVSIFTTHGAAAVPGHEMFACADSPGEAVIPYNFLTQTWDVTLLGHYHQMNPLPGFDAGKTGQAWYAGSLLRRGFSDPEGGRGWLLITVNDVSDVVVERKTVKQRPQLDLPIIDAAHMTVAEVEEAIRLNIDSNDLSNAIVRQRVLNITPATRRSVNTQALKGLTAQTLMWQLEFFRPLESQEFSELPQSDVAATSLATAKVSDLPTMWANWFPQYALETKMAQEILEEVQKAGAQFLQKADDILKEKE